MFVHFNFLKLCLKKLLTKHIHDQQSDLKQTDHDEKS
jgi:hypothetical protein